MTSVATIMGAVPVAWGVGRAPPPGNRSDTRSSGRVLLDGADAVRRAVAYILLDRIDGAKAGRGAGDATVEAD